MDRFKKIMLVACLAVAAVSVVNVNTAEAGDLGYGCAGGICTTPAVGLYHVPVTPAVNYVAPITHCQYKIFIYDCGLLRCVGTYNNVFHAKQRALLLQAYGYRTIIRKVIL